MIKVLYQNIILSSTYHNRLHHWDLTKYLNGLVQDCSNSTANALELLQSCTKPSILSIKYGWKQKLGIFMI